MVAGLTSRTGSCSTASCALATSSPIPSAIGLDADPRRREHEYLVATAAWYDHAGSRTRGASLPRGGFRGGVSLRASLHATNIPGCQLASDMTLMVPGLKPSARRRSARDLCWGRVSSSKKAPVSLDGDLADLRALGTSLDRQDCPDGPAPDGLERKVHVGSRRRWA